MDEPVNAIYTQVNLSFLRKIKVCVFYGEMRNDSMEDDEDEAQPIPANDEVINTIIEMNRHNTLVI